MNRLFIFQHGWGYDRNFWQNLAPYFKKEKCIFLDSGYFGANFSPKNLFSRYSYVGIGHSLGFTKLLRSTIKFNHLVGICSFTNFLGNDQKIKSVRRKEFDTMNLNLTKNFSDTLHNFYKRCNVPMNYQYYTINRDLLYRDFHLLLLPSALPAKIPTLIINSSDDIIVPKAVSLDNFAEQKDIDLRILNSSNHGLGYHQADIIYSKIMSFINVDF